MKTIILTGGSDEEIFKIDKNIPKSMLPIGSKPLLRILVEHLRDCNLKNIVIITNSKQKVIKDYFKDGKWLGVSISYINDDNHLGTAGPLALLKGRVTSSFLVVNGDILTNFDFRKIINFHKTSNSNLTVGVVNYEKRFQYGIIKSKGGFITNVEEKPNFNFLIIAGIYVLQPKILNKIQKNKPYDIPELITDLVEDEEKVKHYKIYAEWMDLGTKKDYEFACKKFNQIDETKKFISFHGEINT